MEKKTETKEKNLTVKEMVAEALYQKENAERFHSGNPFCVAFNNALNDTSIRN